MLRPAHPAGGIPATCDILVIIATALMASSVERGLSLDTAYCIVDFFRRFDDVGIDPLTIAVP
ncbi:MAG TPA: hypothetical protein ENI90_05565 [Methylothermaceae bacterium]|nr:hypothetical protein [Methylothermaceae bacterium]